MNKLDELIQELCPDGVEYKSFGDCAKIVRGASPRPIKNFITTEPDGVNWIKIGDVKPGEKYITSSAEKITLDGAKKSRPVKKGDFILSNSMSFGRPYILKIDGCVHDGWLAISEFSDSYVSDFLYYLLSSNMCQNQMKKKASFGGAVQNLNADIVRELSLPVPPLEVQQEIVYLLDDFTAKTAELLDELNREYEARKKQYNYYRSQLLDGDSETPKMKLKNVLTIQRGKRVVKTELSKDGDYPVYQNALAPMGYYHLKNRNKDNTYLISAGAAGSIGYSTNDFWAADDCFTFECSEVLDNKFLYYSLLNKQAAINLKIRDASIPRLSRDSLENIIISIPPLNNQKKIVEILDKLDCARSTLQSNISIELESRQKQYEYYRDKLLTFKELNESEVN